MSSLTVESPLPRGEMPRKAEFIFPPKRCEWPILSSLTIHEAFFEVPYNEIRPRSLIGHKTPIELVKGLSQTCLA